MEENTNKPTNAPTTPTLTPIESKMIADFTRMLNIDMKEQLLIMVVTEYFKNSKPYLKRAIDYWAGQTLKMQMESIDIMYSKMTDEQKKTAVPVERYKQLFDGTLTTVKKFWEETFELTNRLINPN